MKLKNNCQRSQCPISSVIDLIGDKWTLLILRDMIFLKSQKFTDFVNAPENISTNILTDRLKKLEIYGLIKKSRSKNTHNEYNLTDLGESFRPIMIELARWGAENIEDTHQPSEEFIKKMSQKGAFFKKQKENS